MTDHLFTIDPWPHQREGVEQTIHALDSGTDWVCLTSPTGSGKTQMEIALTQWASEREWKVVLFTNRILLTQQTRRVFHGEGILAGVVSSSMPQYEYEEGNVQIATMQTLLSRRRQNEFDWLDADLVLVDEVHQQASGESAELLNEYRKRGAKGCCLTATPLGVSNVCDKLIVAAGTRELQKSSILCYARWFVGGELDTRKLIGKKVDLSLSESDARRTWGPLRGDDKVRTQIVGHIIEDYERFHPERIHTLAFAPGVKESLWAAQFCFGHGIRSLHIDGQDFWADGKMYDRKRDDNLFQDLMQEWRDGAIPIIWNRFVMREGVDEPCIEAILLATPVGSYRSFLQMVGRGLRVSKETPQEIKVIDLGGNWWRHGSVNVNVDWESVFECDNPDILSKNRIAQLRESGESVGRVCPKCGTVDSRKRRFLQCDYCGHEMLTGKPSRPIVRADGTLSEVNGEPIKQWTIKATPDAKRIWAGLYHNALKKWDPENPKTHFTFNQLYQQYGYKTAVEAGSRTKPAFWKAYYPPRNLPLMPQNSNAWHQLVRDVDRGRLL